MNRGSFGRLPRWALTLAGIAVPTAVSIPVNGYFYGLYDHAYHLARLRWLEDPAIYSPTDPFVPTLEAYTSWFWPLLLPLVRLFPEPAVFLALYFASRCLFGYAVLRLARSLYRSEPAAWLAFSFFLLEKTTSGFYGLPDRELLPRTPAFPLAVFALELYLRGHRVPSLALGGLLLNLHGRLAAHLLLLLTLALVWEARRAGWRSVAAPLAAALVAGAPALAWQAAHPSGVPVFPADPLWLGIVKLSVPTIQNVFAPEPAVWFMHLSTLGFAALFFLSTRGAATVNAGARSTADEPDHRTLEVQRVWVVGTLLLVLLAGVAVEAVPIAPLVQLELVRAAVFLPILALPALAHFTVSRWRAGKLAGPPAAVLSLVGVLCPFGSFIALATGIAGLPRWRLAARAVIVAGIPLAVLSGYLFYLRHATSQNWLVAPPRNAWTEVAAWARESTPRDAVFLVPLDLDTARWGAEFRVAAQRSSVVARHEGDLSALSYGFALEWYERMGALTGGRFTTGAPLVNAGQLIDEGYRSLDEAQLVELAHRYGASYVISQRERPLALAPVFANERFIVYGVP